MKRNVLFSIVTIALFGFAIAFNLNQNHDSESERLVKNVEALASTDDHDEGGGGAGSGYSCTVTTICYNIFGQQSGSVSCSGTMCDRGATWVECNGNRTNC